MSENLICRVFDSVSALALVQGEDRSTAIVLGYDAPNDGGGGQFYWNATSVLPPDGAMVLQVTGVASGRWLRITENRTLNFRWFGGKANWYESNGPDPSSYDNLPAMQRVLNYIIAHPEHKTIFVPAAAPGFTYYFSDTIHVYVDVSIEGEGNTLFHYPTTFSFGAAKKGIFFHYPRRYFYVAKQNVPAGNRPQERESTLYWEIRPLSENHNETTYPLWQAGATYAQGATVAFDGRGVKDGGLRRLRFLSISSQLYQADGQQHGVEANCRMEIEDVAVFYFRGCGFRLHGNVADVPGGSNANFWEMRNCVARFNAEHGIHITGGDINAGNINNFDATSNKYWGILDESLLSCAWTNVHTNNNSIYLGSTSRVHIGDVVRKEVNGILHYFGCLKDHIDQEPVVGQTTPYWKHLGASLNEGAWYTTFRTWSRTDSYETLFYYVARKDTVGERPLPGASNSNWTLVGEADTFSANVYFKWNATTTFRGGGAIATTRATSNSVFMAPYNEMNQGHILLRGGAILFGGETGTPVLEGTFLRGGGGLGTPNGSFSAAGFRSYDGSYSLEFGNYGRDLIRTPRIVEYAVGAFQLSNYNTPGSTFVHQTIPNGKTLVGSPADVTGKRYQFNGGDLSVTGGDFYAEVGVGVNAVLRKIVPFVPITANQHGTHPAFATAQEAIAWLLSRT